MLTNALLIVAILALPAAAGGVKVEGSSPVPLGKKGTAYPVKCSAPIKFSASGPASVTVDVRGAADALGKPVQIDFTRDEKAVSKNSVSLKKSKDGGKRYAGLAQLVLAVPSGAHQYALACDASSELGMSFQVTKKPGKGTPAAAEIALEAPKPAEGAKTAKGEGEGGEGKPGEEGKPPAEGAAAGASEGAYVGLFHPTAF